MSDFKIGDYVRVKYDHAFEGYVMCATEAFVDIETSCGPTRISWTPNLPGPWLELVPEPKPTASKR